MKKVSVIIPMYNAEPYIRQCIQSVILQTWSNLEILVIDDGSTDRSLKVCEDLSRIDDRIRILTQNNQGVSAARNRGIEAAVGEYIFFLDSDDAIHPILIEELIRRAERFQAGLVFCSYVRVNDRQMEERLCKDSVKDKRSQWIIPERRESEECFHIKLERELMCVWGKLIFRDNIKGQRFCQGLKSAEDTMFMYEFCRKQVKMVYTDMEWYYYRIRSNSLSHSNDIGMIRQKLKVYERIRNQEYKAGHREWVLKWERMIVWTILSAYLVMKNNKDQENSRYLKKRMLLEMRNPVYRKLPGGTKGLFFSLLIGCSISPIRAMWVVKQKICRTYV